MPRAAMARIRSSAASISPLLRPALTSSSSKSRGRAILTGGTRVYDDNAGWFVAPTVIDNLPADDACVQEEIFGPVLAVQVADSAEEALALANGTRYGLMAGIYWDLGEPGVPKA